jgi:hypothetical protein
MHDTPSNQQLPPWSNLANPLSVVKKETHQMSRVGLFPIDPSGTLFDEPTKRQLVLAVSFSSLASLL